MSYFKLAISGILFVCIAACQNNGAALPSSASTDSGLATRAAGAEPQSLAIIPSPTPELIDLSPYDGNSNISVYGGSELDFEAEPANLEVKNNVNGIGHVDMYIFDANGNQIDSHRENNSPYCYFADSNDECTAWVFADHGFKWRGGARVTEGLYFARALAYNSDENKVRVEERAFWVDFSGNNGQTAEDFNYSLGAKSKERDRNNHHDEYYDELEFRADPAGDLPIDYVDMFILSPEGHVVSKKTDRTAPYCGFGDAGGDCQRWVFNQHAGSWPYGSPIKQRMYTFRAIAYHGGVPVGANSEAYTVLAPPSTPGQSNTPATNNSASGCCAILADGVHDIDQVSGQLVFRTVAGENGHEGENIDRVEMSILDDQGNQVYQRTEVSSLYCGFGGNEECNAFVFADAGDHWDSGVPIRDNGQYTLIANVYFKTGSAPLRLSKTIVIHLR